MFKSVLTTLLLASFFLSFAQKSNSNELQESSNELLRADDVFEELVELYKKDSLKDAIAVVDKIDRNDTSYVDALMKKAALLLTDEQYKKAIEIDNIGLSIQDDRTNHQFFYINKAESYKGLKEYDKALAVYDEGLKKFPLCIKFIMYKGEVNLAAKRTEEAERLFFEALELNPLDYEPHLKLGVLAAEQGRTVEAIMAFEMSLICAPYSQYSINIIRSLEQLESKSYKKKLELDEESTLFKSEQLLLESKAAYNSKYKIRAKKLAKYGLVRQSQLLYEKMIYKKAEENQWMQFYVKYYKSLYKTDHYVPFNFILYSNLASMQKYITKYSSDIKIFNVWTFDKLSVEEDKISYKGEKLSQWFDNNRIIALGNKTSGIEPKLNGKWYFFNEEGLLMAEGDYNNGEKAGLWKWYNDAGKVKTSVEFNKSDDKRNGVYTSYYLNGSKYEKSSYVDDKVEGKVIYYYSTDTKSTEETWKNDEQDGIKTRYHLNGQKKVEYTLSEGKRVGEYVSYYENGQVFEKYMSNEDGVRAGDYKAFFDNGKPKVVGQYEEGYKKGEWKWYYKSGKLESECVYSEKKKNGTEKTYYENGVLSEESTFEGGKKNGLSKSFDEDGKIANEYEIKKGLIYIHKAYNKKGEVISEQKAKGGTIGMIYFHSNGAKRSEGKLVDGERDGEWKFYYRNGELKDTENYKDGLLDGELRTYYKNGHVKIKQFYVDGSREKQYLKYNIQGNIIVDGWYDDDNAVGYWKFYNDLGNLTSNDYYLYDSKKGVQQTFDLEGNLYNEDYYQNNILYKTDFYAKDSSVIKTVTYDFGSGTFRTYFNNGNLKAECEKVNNQLQGKMTWYHPNGKVDGTCKFVDDEREGEMVVYYDSGKLRYKGVYSKGLRQGIWKWYYENGQLQTQIIYKDGEREGECIWYRDNGVLDVKSNYKNGEKNGESFVYEPTKGEVMYKKYYTNGDLDSYTYKKDGKYVTPIILKNETGKVVAYYNNGQKSIERTFTKGLGEGEMIYYYPNGQLWFKGVLESDEYVGERLKYHPNGKIKKRLNYVLGSLNGVVTTYDINGNKIKEESYVLGNKQGVTKEFYANGKVKSQSVYENDFKMK